MSQKHRFSGVLASALFVAGIASVVVATAVPAGAVEASGTFVGVNCTTEPNIGTQAQDIPYDISAPISVPANQEFTVTLPGGSADLPATVLGTFNVVSYQNLATSYQIQGGVIDQATLTADGPALINGTPISSVVIFPAPDTIKTRIPGPMPPGTLTTPTRTFGVMAGAAGTTINIIELSLTTTVTLGTPPNTSSVAATCLVPSTVLIPINVVGGGPTTTVNAGPDVSGSIGDAVALHGTYDDPFGTPTLSWSIDNPSFCSFADATAADTTVTCTHAGVFAATLSANDGVNPPVSDTALVTVTTPNVPPTVDAGPNVSGEINDDIPLAGTVTDPDNTPNVQWTVDSPLNCSFSDDTSPDTIINCSVAGTYAATLTADDGINAPIVDTAQVVITNPPPGLTVKAGPDASGNTNTPIALTGKITDPGQTATAQWTADNPNCSFSAPTAVATTITCTTPGVVAATLTGHDGVQGDQIDTALVTVIQPNVAPTVNAGPDATGMKNTPISLNGAVTDLDNPTPTITWSSDTPGCTFANSHLAVTTITCASPGVVAATLTADDGVNPPVSDVALVTVLGNAPPIANAGPDVTTLTGLAVALHGSVSDPDSTPTAHWSTGNPSCSFGNPNAADTTIACSAGGIIAATLTASDFVNAPVSDTALVTVVAPNFSPTVDAGPDAGGTARHPVALHGIVTDPDNTPVLRWSTTNPGCTFFPSNAVDTAITCQTTGIFAATLTADDGVNLPVSDTALVTFTSPICTGVCLSIGDAMTYEGGAASLPVTLSQPQGVAVTFTATIQPVPNGAINGYGHPSSFVSDFKSNPVHNVKIAAGVRQVYIAVTALIDPLSEGDETFNVLLSNAAGVTGIRVGRALGVGTIKDTTSVAPGSVLIGSESIVEIDPCLTCKATAKFSVVLSSPAAVPITMRFSTQNAGATAPADYTARTNVSLSFTVGGAIQKAVTVVTIGDSVPEDPPQGINVVFSSPNPPTLLFPNGTTGHIEIIDND